MSLRIGALPFWKTTEVLVTGSSVLDAFDRLEVLESTAEAVINARAIGEVSAMPDAVIRELRDVFGIG